MMLHPPFSLISRFAAGEMTGWPLRRMTSHLARCGRCRAILLQRQKQAEALRSLPVPAPAADLYDRVLARRSTGERRILPSSEPAPARRVGRAARHVAAAMALLVLAVALLRAPALRGQASELRLMPEKPAPGEAIRLEYRPGIGFAAEDRLIARGRVRSTSGASEVRRLGELVRGRDGVYRGVVQLPDSVVYTVLVVEDDSAGFVDSNGRRGWEVLAHGPDGLPLRAALVQRAEDLSGRNWELAWETWRRTAELYPDGVGTWYALHFHEDLVVGEAARDSLRALHRARLERFHESLLRSAAVSDDDAGAMRRYARSVQDSSLAAYWERRLLEEHPRSPAAVQARAVRMVIDHNRSPGRAPGLLLEEMERLWDEAGPGHDQFLALGLSAARGAQDSAAVLRWIERGRYLHAAEAGASQLMQIPALREEGMRRYRARIRRLEAVRPEDRQLLETRAEQRQRQLRDLTSAFAALGRGLVAAGQTQAGVDTLRLAVAGGWNTTLFRETAAAWLALGDTTGALPLLAQVAVDPSTPEAFGDTVRMSAGSMFTPAYWPAYWDVLLTNARQAMHERVAATATVRHLPASVRLADADNRTLRLRELVGENGLVVIFWSRFCGPALEVLPRIQRQAERLRTQGVGVVLVTDEKPSPEFRRFARERQLALPVYHDTHREMVRSFGSWATPEYYVLDADGRIRFELGSLDDIPVQVAALQRATSGLDRPAAR